MRNRKVWLGLACLAASSTLLSSTAHADRRTGLSGNLLIEDPDDLFPFPQHALKHRNMIRLDYGPGAGPNAAVGSSGNGVFTIGDERSAYGVALHRGDLLNPDVVGQGTELTWLSGVGNPFGSTANGAFAGSPSNTPVLPATVFDLFYARAMGDNAFGLRLGFGRGVQTTTLDGNKAGGSQTFIALQGGYSMLPPEGLRLDLSGNLVAALGSSTDAAGDDVNSGQNFRLGLLGRGYYPINAVLDLGFLANISAEFETSTNDPGETDSSALDAGLMAAVGPSINLERAKVAAYGGLVLGFGTREPDSETDDDETDKLQFGAPMVNMAAEVQLLDWLYARTGAQYTWNLTRDGSTPGGDDQSSKTTEGVFGWTAGLGVKKDSFSFDGVVTNGFVTGGPNFIGGTAPGFLAMASVTYKFGEVLSGQGPAQEAGGTAAQSTAVEAAPTAQRAPEPDAPEQESAAPAVEGSAAGSAGSTDTSVSAGGSLGGSIGTP